MSFEYDLICAMREYDLHTNSINFEVGKYHRFRSIGTCKSKCCEYRVFENELGAHFKCFRRGIDRFWFAKNRSQLDYNDILLMQQERDRITRERICAQAKKSKKCASFLEKVISKYPNPPSDHPYVRRKGIYPHSAYQVKGHVVVPIRDIDGDILSLQFIKRNGFKQFKAGAPTAEGMIWLGGHLDQTYSGVIRLCEGWSTGCTIYSLTRTPVVCALNAYNLIKVARLFRTYYINAHVKICADNDQWGKQNVGLNCATQAANENGYALHYPEFDQLPVESKPTDFNDLYLLGGVQLLKRQLMLIKK